MNKKHKLTILGVATIAIIAIAYAGFNHEKPQNQFGVHVTSQSVNKWQAKAPQLFNNIGAIQLIEQSKNKTIVEPQSELVGTITNPFGIRDDILDYILKTIPVDDVRSKISLIKFAYYDQQMLGLTDDIQLNQLANKTGAGIYCKDLSMMDGYNFIKGYDKLLRNTPARLAEQRRIEQLLNHHIISADFGEECNRYITLKEQCNCFLRDKQ